MDDREFEKKLNPEQYRVMRQRGAEAPFTGKYWDNRDSGIYKCAACGNELFSSRNKFDSGTGWPTFHRPISEKDIEFKKSPGAGDTIEIHCKECRSYIGYFFGGDKNYYRANSASLDFEEREGLVLEDIGDTAQDVADKIDQQNQNNGDASNTNTNALTASLGGIGMFLSGGVVGTLVGGVAAFLICQSMCPASQPVASQTTLFTPASTSAPVTPTGTSRSRPVPSSPVQTNLPSTEGSTVNPTSTTSPASASSTTPAGASSSSAAGTP